ncbi:nucleotidyltransferase domain-containing protein [Halomarina litorea]|uniref:nucleotidyltransferase domain-containing protein n=1 Tax=Halomarina litorea TaxID=2961595 RepID=UPI0020C4C42C|nr:hypothetical protein [Halomarina sp. BCD28]
MTYPAAVRTLCDRLPEDLPWAITASANLALRGLPVDPGDVDVVTDAEGVHRIADCFSDAVVRPLVPPEAAGSPTIRSHFGALSLDGCEVELMGDVEHRVDGEWVPAPDVGAVREFVTMGEYAVPVMPLDFEAFGYRARGDNERAALVAKHAEGAAAEARR